MMTVEEAVAKGMNRHQRRAAGMTRPSQQTIKHCHVEVKKVAEGLAQALFEEMMLRNEIFAEFKRQHEGLTTAQLEAKFVAHLWPQLIEQARATMAGMLRSPAYSAEMKEEIMHILVQDATLIRGRKNPATFLGTK